MLPLLCATPMSLTPVSRESFPCIQDHLVWLQQKDGEWRVSCTEEAKSLSCCCGAFLQPVLKSMWGREKSHSTPRSLAFTWRNGSIDETSTLTFPSAAVLWTSQGWVNDRDQAAASAAAVFSFCLTGLFFQISLQVKPSHPNVSENLLRQLVWDILSS